MLSRGIRSGGIPSLARIRGSAVGSFFPRQKVSRCSVTPATRRMFAGVNGKVAVFQLFPAHSSMYLTDERAKLLYFVRHAEGLHNAAVVERKEEFWEKLFDSPEMWDAPLTDKGKEQCARLAQQIDQEGADVDLIVVSPLTRTLQTAELSFGTTHPKAPMVAHELCRERIAVYTSEGRSDKSSLVKNWPKVDFSHVKEEKDGMFENKEKDEEVGMRAKEFLGWIMSRPEKRIAIVSHSVFLQQLYLSYKDTLPEEFYTERQDFAGIKTAMICFPPE